MRKIIYFYFLMLSGIVLTGCGNNNNKQVSDTIPVNQQTVVIPQVVEEIYKYHGELYRDPFIPVSQKSLGSTLLNSNEEASAPNLGLLTLKGIINDKKQKMALLSGPLGSYIVRGSQLYDNRNRIVRGVKGRVGDRSVTVITEDKFERIYKLEGLE